MTSSRHGNTLTTRKELDDLPAPLLHSAWKTLGWFGTFDYESSKTSWEARFDDFAIKRLNYMRMY